MRQYLRHGILVALALFFAAGTSSAQTGPLSGLPSNPLTGSVRAGKAAPEELPLSLTDAIERGLKQNLAVLLSREAIRSAHGQQAQDLSELLPSVGLASTVNVQQLNVRAQEGIEFPGLPSIIGPFAYFDTRVRVLQPIFNWQSIQRVRFDSEQIHAAEYSHQDARELVVLAVGAAYLQTIAHAARVETAEAQRETAQALHQQAVDQLEAGTTAAIDVLRARIQVQTRQQQLILTRNELAKQKLALARLIGLPPGQEFTLTDQPTYRPIVQAKLEEALQRAYASRADHKSLLAQVRAMELARKAAVAESYPSLFASVDYGAIGVTPASSHGTVGAFAALNVPIFQGGRVRGDVARADVTLTQGQQRLDNLRGQIDQEVRSAFLDLQSAAERVEAARSTVDLAGQTLQQARDRFTAGVTDNIEVIQAQESVASASETLITSVYTYNVATIELARATGSAETDVQQLLLRR